MGTSPVYCGLNVKVTLSPTNNVPDGLRVLRKLTSLPAVTLVLKLAVSLLASGSGGVPSETLPDRVIVELAPTAAMPVKVKSTLPLTGTVWATVQL